MVRVEVPAERPKAQAGASQPGMPDLSQIAMMVSKSMGTTPGKMVKKDMKMREARPIITEMEMEKLLDDQVSHTAYVTGARLNAAHN